MYGVQLVVRNTPGAGGRASTAPLAAGSRQGAGSGRAGCCLGRPQRGSRPPNMYCMHCTALRVGGHMYPPPPRAQWVLLPSHVACRVWVCVHVLVRRRRCLSL